MVGHVKIVGILMLAHGITVIIMGGLFAAGSWFMFALPPGPAGGGGPPPELFAVIYGVWGGIIILSGLLTCGAGVRIMMFRNRMLGIVALFANAPVLTTCYCAPTSIAMMIYGLLVLFNQDVVRAFDLVARGATPDEAMARFTPRYGDARDDYDALSSPRADWEERRRRRAEERPDDQLPDRE